MPFDIFGHCLKFCRHFLDFIFAKCPLSVVVCFHQHFNRLGFRNRNQLNLSRQMRFYKVDIFSDTHVPKIAFKGIIKQVRSA